MQRRSILHDTGRPARVWMHGGFGEDADRTGVPNAFERDDKAVALDPSHRLSDTDDVTGKHLP
jgi:hypothetical protein